MHKDKETRRMALMGSTKHTGRMVAVLLVVAIALVYFTMDRIRVEEPQQAAVLRAYAR